MKINRMYNVYKSEKGLTVVYDEDFMGVAYLKLYNIPYTNEAKMLLNSKILKEQIVYNNNPDTNITTDIQKFIEEN